MSDEAKQIDITNTVDAMRRAYRKPVTVSPQQCAALVAKLDDQAKRIAELEAGHATTAVMITVGGEQYGVHVNVASRLKELEAAAANPWRSMGSLPNDPGIVILGMTLNDEPETAVAYEAIGNGWFKAWMPIPEFKEVSNG